MAGLDAGQRLRAEALKPADATRDNVVWPGRPKMG